MPNFPKLIDEDSPSSARTFSSPDGQQYQLVFSDEFNVDGRSFYPGDDPWWEAVDLHYWPTDDLEWYDPEAVTTKGGNLVLTMSELNNHNLSYQSGMLQSWNKVCVNGGYIEVSVSLPGSPSQVGFWPAAWTMGNLGRAGYGATTEGMWPYTYDSCDWGTLPNQTTATGLPTAVHDEMLSFLPGQRASACTCPGSDHPGPSTSVGRGVPEIDILEALTEVNDSSYRGQISQSTQIAPYNDHRWFDNSTTVTTIQNASITKLNHYLGGQYQQTVSALSYIEDEFYGAQAFATYGIEWFSDPTDREKGFMNWYSNGQKTWGITAASIGPDSIANVSARLISEEPMYIILNLGMSPTFQPQNFSQLVFPATMLVDYVRVYQSPGAKNGLSCDPPNRPTADYIAQHSEAYTNANLTTWAQAGHTFPRNSLLDGC
ncbi:unnamed protein product [Mycena citricolor]|uniref:GH16 domain-containing protein n=1 Tax=Mycena citricolor TaxID=2018698 RepID=A0AAD2HX84_9AGAR|nr:unnamed protein product [Mycena citricolor]